MKYPENEKLDEVASVHTTLMQFTEWLAENGYEVKHYDRQVAESRVSDLVYRFMNVDIKILEKERIQMINNAKKINK